MREERIPTPLPEVTEPKLYRRRWYILFLYFNGNLANSLQWMQYSAIAPIIQDYYQVPSRTVDWLNMVFYLCYIVFAIPAMWFLKTKGLRWTALLGIGGTALGGWIKLIAASPDRFFAAMIGQVISGIAQCFIFGLNSEVSALWFGPKELATADTIGALGAQCGVILAFLIPIYLVIGEHITDLGATTNQLKTVLYITSIQATVTLILCLIYFPDKPSSPPSEANAASLGNLRAKDYKTSMKTLLTNGNYIKLLVMYSFTTGVGATVISLLPQVLATQFPDSSKDAGISGAVGAALGFVGAAVFAVIIDKTFKYRLVSNVIVISTTLSLIGYTLSTYFKCMPAVYVAVAGAGLFSSSCYTFGYDFASELAYPVPEGLSSILLTASGSLMGLCTMLISGKLLEAFGDVACNVFGIGLLCIAFIANSFIKISMKRRLKDAKTADAVKVEDDCNNSSYM